MAEQKGTSEQTKTMITAVLLVFVFPIGLILMWFWTKWKMWVKLLITVPVAVVVLMGILSTANPSAQIKKAKCIKECKVSSDLQSCVELCSPK